MKLSTRVASALSFAHLAGIGRGNAAGKAKSETDQDDDRAEDGDDDKTDQDRDDGDSKKSKKGQRAADDEDDAHAEDDEDGAKAEDDEGGEPKKGKRAKAESEDEDADGDDSDKDKDDDEEEMRGKSAVARARRRERARCAAIFASKAAGRNPVLAASLAFNTALTRKQALVVLRDTPAPAANGDRSNRNPSLGAGGEQSANSPKALESRWDAAFSRVRGK